MNGDRDPCEDGLTPACFAARPEYAKRMLAYRLLSLLLGPVLMKRLQTFKAVPLPPSPTEAVGAALSEVGLLPAIAGSSPLYVGPWEPGPTGYTPNPEGVLTMPTIRRAKIDAATAATHELIAAVSGSKISVVSLALTVAGEVNITFLSAATALSGAMDFGGADEPRGIAHTFGDYPLQTAEGEAFNMLLSGAVQVSGMITYYLE